MLRGTHGSVRVTLFWQSQSMRPLIGEEWMPDGEPENDSRCLFPAYMLLDSVLAPSDACVKVSSLCVTTRLSSIHSNI